MLTAFLPCRAGSQRVLHKNTRPFGGDATGLLGIKLRQLLTVPELDCILLSTNDPEVIALAEPFLAADPGRLVLDRRPDHLCSSTTSTDEVIAYLPSVIPEGDVMWTHVTSPFLESADYSEAIRLYRAALAAGTHDSLMGVLELRTFLWTQEGSLNYDRAVEKWPRTQTLPIYYEVNSSIFLAPRATYVETSDRIGRQPLLWSMPKGKSFDVDWDEDFVLASEIWKLRHAAH